MPNGKKVTSYYTTPGTSGFEEDKTYWDALIEALKGSGKGFGERMRAEAQPSAQVGRPVRLSPSPESILKWRPQTLEEFGENIYRAIRGPAPAPAPTVKVPYALPTQPEVQPRDYAAEFVGRGVPIMRVPAPTTGAVTRPIEPVAPPTSAAPTPEPGLLARALGGARDIYSRAMAPENRGKTSFVLAQLAKALMAREPQSWQYQLAEGSEQVARSREFSKAMTGQPYDATMLTPEQQVQIQNSRYMNALRESIARQPTEKALDRELAEKLDKGAYKFILLPGGEVWIGNTKTGTFEKLKDHSEPIKNETGGLSVGMYSAIDDDVAMYMAPLAYENYKQRLGAEALAYEHFMDMLRGMETGEAKLGAIWQELGDQQRVDTENYRRQISALVGAGVDKNEAVARVMSQVLAAPQLTTQGAIPPGFERFWEDSEGNEYFINRDTGEVKAVDSVTGEWKDITSVEEVK